MEGSRYHQLILLMPSDKTFLIDLLTSEIVLFSLVLFHVEKFVGNTYLKLQTSVHMLVSVDQVKDLI